MFTLREKILLAVFTLALALAPCWAQLGVSQGVGTVDETQISGGSPQSGPDIKHSATGIIMGSVRTFDDKAVNNARVEITSINQQRLITQYTSRDGSFAVSSLPAGDYELRAESGVLEANARMHVGDGQNWVTLRMPASDPAPGGHGGPSTVSVQQLRVPEKAASFLSKAHQALMKNQLEEAGKYVSKALVAYPEYAQALALRGILEMQQQRFDEAAADATHAIQADPNYGTGYLVMGAVLNCQNKFQDALRPLERAEMLLPAAWQGYFESGKALLELKKFQDALSQMNRAFALRDGGAHPELHLVKGYAYLGLNAHRSALSEFQQYLSQAPGGPYAAQVRSILGQTHTATATTMTR